MKRSLITLFFTGLLASAMADTRIVLPDDELFADNARTFFRETTIPGDFKSPDEIIRALLTKADQASNKKLTDPFSDKFIKAVSADKKVKSLITYYQGVRQEKDRMIISFSEPAMRYLNSSVSVQGYVKGSLHSTLQLHFPKVKEIDYEIDGEIVSEWDA